MPVLTIGPGQTYDSANGIIDAAAAIPADFSSEIEDWVLEIFRGYDYNTIGLTGIILNPVNTAANKRVVIRAAAGEEHLGEFGNAVTCKITSTSLQNSCFFSVQTDHVLIQNLKCKWDSTANFRTSFAIVEVGASNVKIQNILGEAESLDIGADNLTIARYQNDNLQCTLNNIIMWSAIAYTRSLVQFNISNIEVDINNCVAYNVGNFGFFQNNSQSSLRNCGSISDTDGGLSGRFINSTNLQGSNNFDNCAPSSETPGTSFIRSTTALFGFIDIVNKKFNTIRSSPLVGSGADVSSVNPDSINLQPFTGNHRSPFDNIIVKNSFPHKPLISGVYGQWKSGLLLSDDFITSANPVYGSVSSFLNFNEIYGTDSFGQYVEFQNSVKRYEAPNLIGSSSFCVASLYRAQGSGSGNDNILAATNSFYLRFENSSDNLVLELGAFTAESSLSLIDTEDWFSFVVNVDLTQSVNSEKVKMYAFQKSVIVELTPVFSGSLPSQLPNEGVYSTGPFSQMACLHAWNRVLNIPEIYSILFDPYKIYRDTSVVETLLKGGFLESQSTGVKRYVNYNKQPAFLDAGSNTRVLNG